MAESSGQPSGAARRRRERRLRSMLRHEQQTVRMALAAALHHSAGRSSRTAPHGDRRPPPGSGREWSTSCTKAYGHRSIHSRGSGQVSRRSLSRWVGQSRSVTWLPRRRCWPCRCWPARQAKPSTTPPSSSSSSTPSRRRRPWRRRRGGGRWRKRSHGFAPRSMPVSLSLPPSMRPGTGPPLRPLGRGGRRKRGRGGSSRRLLFLVVGVPVIFSDKFQQFLDRMVDNPVVQQRQELTVFFSVLVQFLDKVVVPVLRNDSDMVRQCRKQWCRSCSSSKVDGLPSCRRGKSPWSCLFRKP